MEGLTELLVRKNIIQRHNCALLIWNMKGDEGYPCLEYVSENIREYGYDAEQYLEGSISWTDQVCEEDKTRVDRESCQFLLHASGNLVQEYRICTREGELVWVEADSCYIEDGDGATAYVETMLRNISRSKEQERILLANQQSMQDEIFNHMEISSRESFKENLIDFIREQRIEILQAAFSDIYGIHAAMIGRDYYFYTNMTGPKEETGIFYDVSELRTFKEKIEMLEKVLDSGQRNVILSMQNPDIRISGVPIFYKSQYVATWVVCCLEEKSIEDILKILEFMRIMAETISEYYGNHMGELSAKGYAFEHYRLQRRLSMQEKLLELYEEMEEKGIDEKLRLILKKAGEATNSGRCTLYEAVPNSIYARRVISWMTEGKDWSMAERDDYSVQALPNPATLLNGREAVVLDSTRIPKEWRSTMSDLSASAAVLMPVEWCGKTGFLCFQEIGQERIWEEECIWFFKEIKKIIEKVLLKSE